MSAAPILLTAGGTGGHVFPAEALAEALLKRGHRIGFVTDDRGRGYGGTLGSLETYKICASGLAGRGIGARLRAVSQLSIGFLQARRLVRTLKPSVVIGFGGYASVPLMLAAALAGVPTAVHEQNAVLGRANRLVAPRSTRIATSFRVVRHIADGCRDRVVFTGMPVRGSVVSFRALDYPAVDEGGTVRILVLGGSQGARILSDVVPAALTSLPPALRDRLSVSQQCRSEDLESVRRAYAEAGIHVSLASFFQDIPARLAEAHLVIARAGASTVAELTAIGRPAILIPFPQAIDDHQTANAQAVDATGGAWLIPQAAFTAEALATRIRALFSLPGTLTRAAACARAAGAPDAAESLATLVEGLLPAGQAR